jgi:hypothetical protein
VGTFRGLIPSLVSGFFVGIIARRELQSLNAGRGQ